MKITPSMYDLELKEYYDLKLLTRSDGYIRFIDIFRELDYSYSISNWLTLNAVQQALHDFSEQPKHKNVRPLYRETGLPCIYNGFYVHPDLLDWIIKWIQTQKNRKYDQIKFDLMKKNHETTYWLAIWKSYRDQNRMSGFTVFIVTVRLISSLNFPYDVRRVSRYDDRELWFESPIYVQSFPHSELHKAIGSVFNSKQVFISGTRLYVRHDLIDSTYKVLDSYFSSKSDQAEPQ